jgi:hypothetical protein
MSLGRYILAFSQLGRGSVSWRWQPSTARGRPSAYSTVERDTAAASGLQRSLAATGADVKPASAEQSGLPDSSATVVYGEAMLSMQTQQQKQRIMAEARRLLVSNGRYAIHELCFLPDDISDGVRHEIQAGMSKEFHVGVQPLTRIEWINFLQQNGFRVTWSAEMPMHLLEPYRLLQDEGFDGALRFVFNIAKHATLRRRILAMRQLFRQYREHLGAISLVGQREPC